MKKSMKPDNNNLDNIMKQARQLPKAQFGFIKGMTDATKNKFNAAGKIAGGDLMGGLSQATGMKPEQLAGLAMKAGMAAAGVPPIMKKGGSMKNKKC